eukprot:110417-Amphidinium_carterae.5
MELLWCTFALDGVHSEKPCFMGVSLRRLKYVLHVATSGQAVGIKVAMGKKAKAPAAVPVTPTVQKVSTTALAEAWDKEAPSTAKNVRQRGNVDLQTAVAQAIRDNLKGFTAYQLDQKIVRGLLGE